MQKTETRSAVRKQRNKWWAHFLPVWAAKPYQSQCCHIEMCQGVVESKDSHRYSSSHYSRRLQSPLTTCFCSHHWRCHCSELPIVQNALNSYSNGTRRPQFSHSYALQSHRRLTGLPCECSPYTFFLTFPAITQRIWFGEHITIFRNAICSITAIFQDSHWKTNQWQIQHSTQWTIESPEAPQSHLQAHLLSLFKVHLHLP